MKNIIKIPHEAMNTPGGTRTHNRLIRSQTPYPLGHGRRRYKKDALNSCFLYSVIVKPWKRIFPIRS